MELAEPTIKKNGNQLSVTYGDDNSNYVEFEQVAVENAAKSKVAGCPQYDNKDFIRIMFPGDKTKIINRLAREDDKMKYPRQWAAYQAQETQVASGLPIDKWAPLTKAEAMNMKAMMIHTVEALASIPDTALTWFGARKYRDMAVAHLAQAKDGSAVLALKSENENLKTDLEDLKRQVKELAALKMPEEKKTLTLKEGNK